MLSKLGFTAASALLGTILWTGASLAACVSNQTNYCVYLDVYVPFVPGQATPAAGQPDQPAHIDDCVWSTKPCTSSVAAPLTATPPNPDGAKSGIPSGHAQILLSEFTGRNPFDKQEPNQFAAYTDARNVLTLSAELFERSLTSLDQDWPGMNYGSGVLYTIPVKLPETLAPLYPPESHVIINLPQKSSAPRCDAKCIEAQWSLYAEADAILAFSEQSYLRSLP